MRVLKLILGNIIFYANFPSVSIFQCEEFGQSTLTSGRKRLRRPDVQVTRLYARGLVACICGTVGPDGLVMCPDMDPTMFYIAFSPGRRTPVCFFFLSLFVFSSAIFSCSLMISR
jgi:hypothetical protein